jgi:aryl carrier-like protein
LELGLRSIDAIRIANLVSEELGGEIAFDEFLREPTLRALSAQLTLRPHAGAILQLRELPVPGEPADVEEFIL